MVKLFLETILVVAIGWISCEEAKYERLNRLSE